MSSTVKLSFNLLPVGKSGLGFEAWLDEQCVYQTESLSEPTVVNHEFNDNNGEHTLRFVLKNKKPEHTQIDSNGEIVSDTYIDINNITFDEIELTHDLVSLFVYTHNFNNTGPESQQPFYNTMGCNGTAELRFTTPIYLWLLENM